MKKRLTKYIAILTLVPVLFLTGCGQNPVFEFDIMTELFQEFEEPESQTVVEIPEDYVKPELPADMNEAYVDFSDGSCAVLTEKYNNLVVVGTFSKSRGMAGARLGYIITNPTLAKDIETVKYSINPYNVNSLTQAAGAAVLENDEYYKECIEEICETREGFSASLKKLGFEVIPSKTNFVFAKHNELSGKYI